MYSEFKWVVIALLVFFGGIFGGLFMSERMEHEVKMECVKAKGMYVKGSCMFPSNR